jgi:hypothetical protein
MRLETACQPVFARHETFHPRYGWLKKAYDAAATDPDLFNRDEAVVHLGVGKNMVRSIRFWGTAFGVIANRRLAGSRIPEAAPTQFGELLFGNDGWDPFGESPGAQWLLHWRLLAPGSVAPVWWLAFNEFPGVEFTAEELEQFVADRTRDWAAPHPSAVRKDVQCLLRMYSSGQSARATFDDVVDCPFRELLILRPSHAEPGAFRFELGAKPTLPPAIVAYACLDFQARTDPGARVVNVNRLAGEHGSPGRAFRLSEADLAEALERAALDFSEFGLTSSAGALQVTIDDPPAAVATDVLRDHHRRYSGDVRYHGVRCAAGPDSTSPLTSDLEAEVAR